MAKQEYWSCVVGPVDFSTADGDCQDFPMRQAVKQMFWQLFGQEPELVSSGWGLPPERVPHVSFASYSEAEKLMEVRAYTHRQGAEPRHVRAWRLLLESEGVAI